MNCDILCITEHWIQTPISIEVCNSLISEYYCGGMFCRSHYNRGGAAIFRKEGMSCNPIDVSDLIIGIFFEAVALLFETFTCGMYIQTTLGPRLL